MLKLLADKFPNNKLSIICHSHGSRVVIRALALALKEERDEALREELLRMVGRIVQVVLLGGAEYVVEAQLLMRRLGAAQLPASPQFYNVVSRENDVLDKLGENFGPRTFGNSQVIGHYGLDIENRKELTNWIDLQIDRAELQTWMEVNHAFKISGDRPDNVWDHWYYYTLRGNMEIYKSILREPNVWRIPDLRERGIPDVVPRRW